MSLFFFGNNFYKNREMFMIFSPQILEVYRILLVEPTLELMFYYTFSCYVRSMHHTAVWQHSSNSNIKIVQNSIEHFLGNSSDFFSDAVHSCLRIVFTNLVFQVPPQRIVRWVEILGIEWAGVIDLMRNESAPWEVILEVFKCSVWEMRHHQNIFSNRTLEYHRHNFPWDRLISRQTDNPWLSYSHDLNPPDYFLRGYLKDRVCDNNPQTGEGIIRKEIRRIPHEMLNRVVDNFNVRVAAVLSYSNAVLGMNIVLITEKV